MNGLLHYAYLKGMRDRSLPIFVLCIPVQLMAMLIGYSVFHRHLQYPLMRLDWADADVTMISMLMPSVIATLSAFWTFRSEVATRAVGSFVIASRSITVVAALIAFAAATAIAGLIGALAMTALLTASFPSNFAALVSGGSIAALTGASLGTLYVAISPQPMMLVWAFIAGIPLVPWIFRDPGSVRSMMAAIALAVVCTGISTFLLRRRCAT